MTHELKIKSEYLHEVLSGRKTFEFRYNDRNYTLGDILHLKEYDKDSYGPVEVDYVVTYLIPTELFIPDTDYVIMSIEPVDRMKSLELYNDWDRLHDPVNEGVTNG